MPDANNIDQEVQQFKQQISQTKDNRFVLPSRGNKSEVLSQKVGFSYTLKDYNWNSEQYNVRLDANNSGDATGLTSNRLATFLSITEFQPVYFFQWLRQLENLTRNGLALFKTGQEGIEAAADLALNSPEAIQKLRTQAKNILFAEANPNPNDILDTPIQLMKSILQGRYVAQYELPYDPEGKIYINAKGSKGWQTDGEGSSNNSGFRRESTGKKSAMEKTFDIISTVNKIAKNNFPISYPQAPDWKPTDTMDAPEVTTEIYLYNNNFDNLVKNFRFMTALVAGAFWMQINFKHKSPNLYNVYFPGYFEYFYCTMDIDVTGIGTFRKIPNIDEFLSKTGFNISPETFFPDAYKLNISFKSIVPNNFNVFANQLVNGPQSHSVVTVGAVQQNQLGEITTKTASNVVNTTVKAYNATTNATSNILQKYVTDKQYGVNRK
jgi:hypothetical protein